MRLYRADYPVESDPEASADREVVSSFTEREAALRDAEANGLPVREWIDDIGLTFPRRSAELSWPGVYAQSRGDVLIQRVFMPLLDRRWSIEPAAPTCLVLYTGTPLCDAAFLAAVVE